MPGTLPLTITSPAPGATVTTPTVTVTGTTAPGARVAAESDGPLGGTAGIASATADSSGSWTLALPTSFASTTITVTATQHRSTGYVQQSIIGGPLPGTTVLDMTDPTGDDSGPGTYQYPTSSNFTAGSFDLTHFSVSQDGTSVYIEVQLRALVPTFGALFGAQLLDVYVHNPAATATSATSARSGVQLHDRARRRLERATRGPGVRLAGLDVAFRRQLGTAQFVADAPSRTATLIVPESTFGTVGSGWVFTVALTGQDGFSPGQARTFTQPAGGVHVRCLPHQRHDGRVSATNRSTVPKVMDTVPPAGVSQATELNPDLHPSGVQLQGVTVP